MKPNDEVIQAIETDRESLEEIAFIGEWAATLLDIADEYSDEVEDE